MPVCEFDIARKDALREQLDELAAIQSLCLDLSHVDYVDSTSIGEPIRLHKHRTERGFDTKGVVVGENQPFRIERDVPPVFLAEPDGVSSRTIAFSGGALRVDDGGVSQFEMGALISFSKTS